MRSVLSELPYLHYRYPHLRWSAPLAAGTVGLVAAAMRTTVDLPTVGGFVLVSAAGAIGGLHLLTPARDLRPVELLFRVAWEDCLIFGGVLSVLAAVAPPELATALAVAAFVALHGRGQALPGVVVRVCVALVASVVTLSVPFGLGLAVLGHFLVDAVQLFGPKKLSDRVPPR